MNKPSYVCSKCSRAFSRRYNTQGHSDTVHKGLSNINIKYKSGNSVSAFKNKPDRYHPSFAGVYKPRKYGQIDQNNAKYPTFKPFNNGGSPLKKPKEPVVTMDEGEKEDFVDITSEKMANHLKKLERLFNEKLYPKEPTENIKKCYTASLPLRWRCPIR